MAAVGGFARAHGRRGGIRSGGRAGFTLIEVLVALAVIAVSLTAIGELVSVSMRGTQSIEQRVAFRQTLRAIVTLLPNRQELVPGSVDGSTSGYDWRRQVAPYASTLVDPKAPTRWQPEAVEFTVRSPSGQILRVDTIRLGKRPG
jgi:general secretion pathway protein I